MIPPKYDISEVYLPHVTRKFDEMFDQEIKMAEDYSITVEFDHWTELAGRSLLNLVATRSKKERHLFHL